MQHWLSFASHMKGFLGAVIVEAQTPKEALTKARRIAGDQLLAETCSIQGQVTSGIPDKYLNRLITKPEIYDIGESTLAKGNKPNGLIH